MNYEWISVYESGEILSGEQLYLLETYRIKKQGLFEGLSLQFCAVLFSIKGFLSFM